MSNNQRPIFLFTLLSVALAAVLFSGCRTAPLVPQETPGTEQLTPTDALTVVDTGIVAGGSGEIVAESGYLVVVYSGAENEPPKSEATVIVFQNDRVVHTGRTLGGAYRAGLPAGAYDVSILTASLPPGGMIAKAVEIRPGETTVVNGRTPSEGVLAVQLLSPSGFPPRQTYTVIVNTANTEVSRTNVPESYAGKSSHTLRTDLVYDVLVRYGAVELQAQGVQVERDGAQVQLVLPYNEGTLKVKVEAGGRVPDVEARIVLLDASDQVLVIGNTTQGEYSIVLPADAEYTLRVQYLDQVEERPFQVIPDTTSQQTFDFDLP